MKIGVGWSNEKQSRKAGEIVGEKAMRDGKLTNPDFCIAFCDGQMGAEEFFAGLRSVLGDTPVIGGSSIGLITNDFLNYTDSPSGALLIESSALSQQIVSANNINLDTQAAGKKLAEQLILSEDEKLFLIFYDSIKAPPTENTPPIMNGSPHLIRGIEEGLVKDIPIFGAGLLGDFAFNCTKQFCGSHISTQAVVGLLLGGTFSLHHKIMHGCEPLNGVYHTITRKDGSVIYEVDNKPIVELIDKAYGNTSWRKEQPVNLITIGINYGEKFEGYIEEKYVNRLIAGTLPNGQGIVMFEPDLEEGMEIQLMLRDTGRMVQSVRDNTTKILSKIEANNEKAKLGIYIDCAGRTAQMSNTITEEATEVQRLFNENNIPLFGFYSGVEIAPYNGLSRGLDWTGLLLVIAE